MSDKIFYAAKIVASKDNIGIPIVLSKDYAAIAEKCKRYEEALQVIAKTSVYSGAAILAKAALEQRPEHYTSLDLETTLRQDASTVNREGVSE